MSRPPKHRYDIDLTRPRGPGLAVRADVRPLTVEDRDALAQLILDAYTGTIDYEGETIGEARDAIDDWLDDAPLLSHSFGATIDGRVVSAVLAMMLDDRPFISIVMTAPDHKRSGLGSAVVAASLESLRTQRYTSATLYITDGNEPSERLFASMGAIRTDDEEST